MSHARRHRAARSELRHEPEIDERQLEFCALARVDEIAVRQHRGSAADRRALHGRDDGLVEIDERAHQAGLWGLDRPGRILEKISHVIAGAERVSGAVPQHDTDCLVVGGRAETVRQARVHGRRHRVLLVRAIQFDPQDAAGTLGDDIAHCLLPCSRVSAARPRVPLLSARHRFRAGRRCPSRRIPAPGGPLRCARRGRAHAGPAPWRRRAPESGC